MATVAVLLKVDGERVTDVLQEARQKLDGAGGELILDFSSVRRVNPGALKNMQELAALAQEKSVKLVLRGVHVDVYKVLKLAKVTAVFSFSA